MPRAKWGALRRMTTGIALAGVAWIAAGAFHMFFFAGFAFVAAAAFGLVAKRYTLKDYYRKA